MRWIRNLTFALGFAMIGGPALSAPLDTRADIGTLDRQDKRFVQGALALDGTYWGWLDGLWGKGSQGALETWAERDLGTGTVSQRALGQLARGFNAALRDEEWRTVHSAPHGLSFLLPAGLTNRIASGDDLSFQTKDGQLSVRLSFKSIPETLFEHGQVLLAHRGGQDEQVVLRRTDVMITSARRGDGVRVYAYSVPKDGKFATATLNWREAQDNRARLMISSIAMGQQPDLMMTPGGALQGILAALRDEKSTPPPKQGPKGLAGNAVTGFYINNTDIVTSVDIVHRCEKVMLEDRTRLSLVQQFPRLGLAVMTGPDRSRAWLGLAAQKEAGKAGRVRLLHYETVNARREKLFATEGNITERTTAPDNAARLILDTDAPRGSQGAPVLDRDGRVVGVMVRMDRDERGAFDRGTRLAAPVDRLRSGLRDTDILFVGRAAKGDPGPESIASAREAVVPVFCR